jgi:hypothetical protein
VGGLSGRRGTKGVLQSFKFDELEYALPLNEPKAATTTTRSGWKSGKLYQSLLSLPADQPMSRNGKQYASAVRIHVDQGAFSEGAYKEPTGAGSPPYG